MSYLDQIQTEKVALSVALLMILDACCVQVVALCAENVALLTVLDVLNGVLVSNVGKLDFGPFGNVEDLHFGSFAAALWTGQAGNRVL